MLIRSKNCILRFVGQTADFGESTDDELQPLSEKLDRILDSSKGSFKDFEIPIEDGETFYRPEDDSLYDSTTFVESLKKSLKTQTAAFADFFKTALFSKDG